MRAAVMTAVAALVLSLGLSLGLAACAPQARTPEQIAAADCAARGGEMTPVGRLQSLQCVVAYPDAGKACRSGSDCRGDCRVAGSVVLPEGRETTGVCSPDNTRFGCHTTIENGRAQAMLCVD